MACKINEIAYFFSETAYKERYIKKYDQLAEKYSKEPERVLHYCEIDLEGKLDQTRKIFSAFIVTLAVSIIVPFISNIFEIILTVLYKSRTTGLSTDIEAGIIVFLTMLIFIVFLLVLLIVFNLKKQKLLMNEIGIIKLLLKEK